MIRESEGRAHQRNGVAGCSRVLALSLALGCGGSNSPSGNPGTNHSPVAVPIASTTAVVMGQSTDLRAQAIDRDGDALTYSWSQTSPASPQGTFSSTTSDAPTWTAPTVGATTPFTLAVTVSDGKGGSGTATLMVYAKTSTDPSFLAEVSTVLARACASCHGGGGGPPPQLTVEASASYAALVNVPAMFACTSEVRVKPGDPDHSVLFQRMIGSTCGDRMPATDPAYYDRATNELALVRTWIQNGAPNN